MIHHVVGLFTHPDQEWKEIRGDQEESISHMYLTHTLILAAIPAVSAFIGTTQVGWVIGNRAPVMLTFESALWMTIMSYLAMLGGVAVMGAFVHWMARTYDPTRVWPVAWHSPPTPRHRCSSAGWRRCIRTCGWG